MFNFSSSRVMSQVQVYSVLTFPKTNTTGWNIHHLKRYFLLNIHHLKRYFLLKMVIFQPVMLVFRDVRFPKPVPGWLPSLKLT